MSSEDVASRVPYGTHKVTTLDGPGELSSSQALERDCTTSSTNSIVELQDKTDSSKSRETSPSMISSIQVDVEHNVNKCDKVFFAPSNGGSDTSNSASCLDVCSHRSVLSKEERVASSPLQNTGLIDHSSPSSSSPNRSIDRTTVSKDSGENIAGKPRFFASGSSSKDAGSHQLYEEITVVGNVNDVVPGSEAPDQKLHLGGQWSLGATYHDAGQCLPCGFAWRPGGCTKGEGCPFCHMCEQGTIQQRRKERKKAARERMRAEQAEL
eukprot:TRINITY_DN17194_c0_g2_i1.p1 TRINITY_DN17194_c0_g2~~TRINITY_DN17194_c0_g2_i1.p1  ORF type:complete len:267 (+),score=26.11 TRINITY_DN17194_c0_g2_i1:35-835(+)